MPTTSNFGWTTPADTDLVKDGAAAIRTLGNGIDTSFLDLKGGTSGQILAKNSATDLDFVWVANDQGDITAVTAGTGISGGGTSGAVTITNSMATEITAKGDLIVGTGNAAFDNLPVGTNGHVLTADSTVSPTGLKWAAPAGGGKVLQVVQATYSTETGVSNNTWTNTGLSASITPASASNKVLIMVSHGDCGKPASTAAELGLAIVRTTTFLVEAGGLMRTGTNTAGGIGWTYAYLDSPATTSATTYKTQFNNSANTGGSVYVQYSNHISTILLLEIGA